MNATKAKVCLGCLLSGAMLSSCGSGTMPMQPVPVTPNLQFVYVVNAISSTVSGFSVNSTSGALTPVGPAVPAEDGSIYAAAAPDGKFLYVANAELDSSSVSAYVINPLTGVLTPTNPSSFKVTGDTQPFGIAVDPTSTHVYTTNTT